MGNNYDINYEVSGYLELPRSIRRFVLFGSVVLFATLSAFTFVAIRSHILKSIDFELADPALRELSESEEFEEQKIVIVRAGDNLSRILKREEVLESDTIEILKLKSISSIANSLKQGQKISLSYDIASSEEDESDLTKEVRKLNKLVIEISRLNSIEIYRNEQGSFTSKNTVLPLKKSLFKSSVVINKNFISALKELGLNISGINDLVSAYSHQVDFQRQLKPGSKVTVIAEKFVTEDGKFSHHGKILYSSLRLDDKEYKLYGYPVSGSKRYEFFSEEGKSVKRNLLRTPINLVRISSKYGDRKHPISGFTKKHEGVDFAAPDGTPIYAAGDGVITEMGFKSGYGRFIQIKHSANLSTAYAHASKFATGLQVGERVKQGRVIAYVGHSGRTTGSHLHYEVKIAGKKVDPMSVKTIQGSELLGDKLKAFRKHRDGINLLSLKLDKEKGKL
jgi:murein DD-endopeptidase MepM/ murein hydrolase activator NlpD